MNDNILFREDITENVIAIKINHSYKENISEAGLYDIVLEKHKNKTKNPIYGHKYSTRLSGRLFKGY